MNLSPRKLFAISTLARIGHFGRAAQELGISQPTLSRHLQDLEDKLGETLFDRHTRSVTLTPFGKEVVRYADDLASFNERASRRLTARKTGMTGHVTIAALPSLVSQVIAPVLAVVRSQRPDIGVEILDLPSAQIKEAVLAEMADIGLDSPGYADFDGLLSERIFEDDLCVVVSRDHPLAQRSSITVLQLSTVDLIASVKGTSLRHLTEACFLQNDLPFRPVQEFNQVMSILGLIEHGLGAAILPASTGHSLPASCVRIDLADDSKRVIEMLHKTHARLDPATEFLTDVIRKAAKDQVERP